MDIERPHRTTSTPTTTSELFICFTSRLSKSSSMRLSSKSILSPARAAAVSDNKGSQFHSLSTSLSRRLRHNGSVKGGAQSPAMFPSSKKNKGSSGFADNPEPSSPKVTCIGQVRVKTKKQGKKMKMRACRSKRLSSGVGGAAGGGETSFRRIEHSHSHEGINQGLQNQQNQQECGLNHRNQRWVHLPLTICEALRTFGSEFSCLFPCKSSCFSGGGFCGGGGDKGDKAGEEREIPSPTSCAVFRWLVSLQDGEGDGDGGGKRRRDIELVVGGEEEEEVERRENRVMMMERDCSRRRSIFDDMEFDDLFTNNNVKNNDNGSGEIIDNDVEYGDGDDDCDEKGGRVSVCVPPKNALLLMRCRSDPLKMASLSRKLWEVPLPQPDDDDNVEQGFKEVKVVEREAVSDDATEEIGKVKTEEIREDMTDEIREHKTEEIQEDETYDIGEIKPEENRDEKTEEVREEREYLVEGNEEIDQCLETVEVFPEFFGEELKETEEKQSVEDRGMLEEKECEALEEIQLIEDDNDADECLIEALFVEEKVEDDKNEQDLVVINSEESLQKLAKAEEEERESVALLETDELSIVHEEEERERERERGERGESSDISSSSLNSSEESTAESKEREDEEEQEQEEEKDQVEEQVQVEEEEEEARKSMDGENKKKTLPDCLLLMMCEPKVSMEVSKETWVCSTDFIRWLPERHQKKVANKTDGPGDSTTKKNKPAAVAAMPPHLVKHVSVQRYEQAAQPPIQPGRSSISFPAGGGSVANLLEQKLVKCGGYKPFVLTRCKSAPLREKGVLSSRV
ncbi:hypothetical protein SOVF_059210 [Spinacia oleracea]|nr:hypothetical protein SOVF_059210 [Spinacia oleracea]